MRSSRAWAGFAVAVLVAVVGVGLQWGLPWALMVGGVVAAAAFLILVDVAEPREEDRG